jgi:uncharacterized membrane protein
MEKGRLSIVGLLLVVSIFAAGILLAVYNWWNSNFVLNVENVALSVLNTAINILYLMGAALIVLGSILVTIRYFKFKNRTPYEQFPGLPRARYLTISLEIFIGAEIIKTVIARNYEEFILLVLTIAVRGLVAFILHLERRWHGIEDDKPPPE